MTDTAAPPVTALLDRLRATADQIAAEMVAAYTDQIAEYRDLSEQDLAEVEHISRENIDVWLATVADNRPPRTDELANFTASARERARQQFPLESLLHAYRVGGRVVWAALRREIAGGSLDDLATGLELADLVLRYVDQVSTAVADAYLDEREELITTEERHHHQVAELLLQEGPCSIAAEERAAAGGLRLADSYWAVTMVVPSRPPVRVAVRRLRESPTAQSVIAVPAERDVLLLWPADPDADLSQLRAAHQALRTEGVDTLMAVAGPSTHSLRGVAEESKTVAALASDVTGLVRLSDIPLRALIHQTGQRAIDIARTRVAPLLDFDCTHGGELCTTLQAFIACRASARDTADRLYVHRNTVGYRLGRIASLTGLDPRQPRDLFLLDAGLELSRHLANGWNRTPLRED